jgi:hypothetical protein
LKKIKLLHNVLFLPSLSLPVALGQQCDIMEAALRKDLADHLDKLDVFIDEKTYE